MRYSLGHTGKMPVIMTLKPSMKLADCYKMVPVAIEGHVFKFLGGNRAGDILFR